MEKTYYKRLVGKWMYLCGNVLVYIRMWIYRKIFKIRIDKNRKANYNNLCKKVLKKGENA